MKSVSITTILLLIFLVIACSENPDSTFVSSYQNVNWDKIGYYDMQIHVHPGIGDEQYDPHQTIDRYHEEGFKILAFTPHDYDVPDDYIDNIYPWTQ